MLSKSNQYLVFWKYAACFLLNISSREYQTIRNKYGDIIKKAHGNIGNIIDEQNISTLKLECALHIKNIANEQGKQDTIRFMREHCKIQVQDTEVDTAELPSYCTKHQIYGNYCQDKSQQAKTNARGDYKILKRLVCSENTYNNSMIYTVP